MTTSIFVTQVPWLEIMLRAATIYTLVIFGLRVTGKRQIGQLTPFDLVLLLLISNAVQNAMTGPDTSLLGGLIAAGTLLILNSTFGTWVRRSRFFQHLIEGSPTVLINNGHVIDSHLRKENIIYDELKQALREHGVLEFDDVRSAVLEVDGSISVIKKEDVTKEYRTQKHFRQFKKRPV
jgi:uncharacterized membrane protein YcaP (DUF421 family)